ncbi:MAG: hypothetical protein NXI00_23520 [Cytophagales bacterium]|nr:hypothetical protein [Cytophagales bacterium]
MTEFLTDSNSYEDVTLAIINSFSEVVYYSISDTLQTIEVPSGPDGS